MELSKHLSKLIPLLLAGHVCAADITPGYTFTAGQSVSHVELNALGAGTINSTFITGQSSVTSPDSAGQVVIYDATAGALRSVTLNNLIFTNANLIYGRGALTLVTNDDLLLLWDASAAGYVKATMDNAVFANTNLLAARTESTTTNSGNVAAFQLLVSSNGTYYRASLSNLIQWGTGPSLSLSNLVLEATPTNTDRLLVWDSLNNTNKSMSFSNLFLGPTNAPTNLVDANVVLVGNSNGTPTKLTLAALLYPATNTSYAAGSDGSISLPASGVAVTNAHGLGRLPLWVDIGIFNLTNDNGHATNTYMPLGSVAHDPLGTVTGTAYRWFATTTSIIVSLPSNCTTNNIKIPGVGTNYTLATFNQSRWRLLINAK